MREKINEIISNKHFVGIALIVISLIMATPFVLKSFENDMQNVKTVDSEGRNGSEDGKTDGTGNKSIPIKRSDELIEAENRELAGIYSAMKEDNPDFAGFLRISGTKLEYPVMYTPYEPEKYLHLDINGIESEGGLPFIDTRCDVEPESDNIIIYGHNMKDGSMFASLMSYQDRAYFEEHPIIRYDTVDEIREYEVMSVFYDRVYYTDETDVFKFYDFINAENKADFDYNIGQYLKKSVYDTGVKAEYGDKLITLVTCAYHTENGRFVVVARRK